MRLELKRNSLWSIAEVLTSGVSLFFLYRYVVSVLGLKSLGVWSLVLATTSLARLGDLGTAAGLSRFVALSLAKNDHTGARDLVETALLTNLAIYSVAGLIFFVPLWWGLEFIVPTDSLELARNLLPYALGSFALLNINSVVLTALIGKQRTDLKCKIVICSLLTQVATVLATVPLVGLIGMGLGQLAQYIVATVASWVAFRSLLGSAVVSLLPTHFNRKAFGSLFEFGIKLQAANLISFVFEPATKMVLSTVCGLETLGTFEMAYRLVLQVRHLIVAPMQQLVPAFAHYSIVQPDETARLYAQAMIGMITIGVPLLGVTAFLSPLISLVWVGSYQAQFVSFCALLCLGWLANALGTPAYFLGLSSGSVRWNIAGHIVTSCGSPILGYVLGKLFGATALVFGVALALLAGSALAMIMNAKDAGLAPLPPSRTLMAGLAAKLDWIIEGFKGLFAHKTKQ